MQKNITVGIDLAGKAANPTGWTLLKNKQIQTYHLYKTKEMLAHTFNCYATLAAIEAPLTLSRKNSMRETDKCISSDMPCFPLASKP